MQVARDAILVQNGLILMLRTVWAVFLLPGLQAQATQAQSEATLPFEVSLKIMDVEQRNPMGGARLTLLSAHTLDTLAKNLVTDPSGTLSTTVDVAFSSGSPNSYWVDAAFPNPVSSGHNRITIQYALFGDSAAEPALQVFDVLGRKMKTGDVLPAGLYFYRLLLPNGLATRAQSIVLSTGARLASRLEPVRGQSINGLPLDRGVHDLHLNAIVLVEKERYASSEHVVSLSATDPTAKQLAVSRDDSGNEHRVEVASPDGRVVLTINIRDDQDGVNCLFYRVSVGGRPVVLDSRLGIVLRFRQPLGCDLAIGNVIETYESETWDPINGERNHIPNIFNAIRVELKGLLSDQHRFWLEARAFNEGAAFRYVLDAIPGPGPHVVTDEVTQLRFPPATVGYAQYYAQGGYERTRVDDILDGCHHPLTVEYADGRVATFTEAAVVDYARMTLNRVRPRAGLLKSVLEGSVRVNRTPFETPWRVFIVGDTPGELLTRNYLLENLNPQNELKDTSWIRPGTAIRSMSNSTEGALGFVDFAYERKIDYVHFDAHWYGDPNSILTDATTPEPGLDVQRVTNYAAERDIGIFLYVDRRALESQLDDILAQFQRWGVKGLKLGFVKTNSQRWNSWLVDLVRRAAEHRLMVDVHDNYVPTGISRTLPNLLTQEGIKGNEEMPSARHNVTVPFTRFVAGAADYTMVYYEERLQTSRTHQLALPVVYYSPLQFLFWYDYPALYHGEPELAFWENLPTVWDETRVLHGKIGEYVTVARRSGDEWYLGSLNNEHEKTLEAALDFLDTGRTYKAFIYADDLTSTGERTSAIVLTRTVDSSSTLQLSLAGLGGQAIHFVPSDAGDDVLNQ